jgi:hypothetical protein
MRVRIMSSILGPLDEGRDTLMSAGLDPPDAALESWRRWERSGADARTDPVARRWLPLIGRNLRDAPVDPPVRALFAEARRHAWASNLRLLDAARPAIDSLAAAGIRTMLLKGAVLVNPPYGEPGLRPIGDVDVLVDPVHAHTATSILEESGWVAWSKPSERDLLLTHALNLWKPPHGAIDVHWYLLFECRWAGVDEGVWQRALPMPSVTSTTVVPAAADLLFHICVHGLRWSPVHAGHWVADAAGIIQTCGGRLDWDVVIAEAARRRLGLQMTHALRVVRERGHVDVPEAVIARLKQQPVSWRDRRECRVKGRPVLGAGLFAIWTAWRRSASAARAAGRQPPPWTRFLAAALGVATPAALIGWFAARTWARTRAAVLREPPHGTSTRTRIVARR